MKSYQVEMSIVNCTNVQLKCLKMLTGHRIDVGIANMYMMQIIKLKLKHN